MPNASATTKVVVDHQMGQFLVHLGNPDCDLCGQPLSAHRWYTVQQVSAAAWLKAATDTVDNVVVDCSKPKAA